MTGNILNIKISIPPQGANVLDRPQLLKGLWNNLEAREGFARQLTLVSAPAGFGKTTLARSLLEGKEKRSAWYSLDQGDNERDRFWLYLASALQSVEENLGRGTMEILRSSSLDSDSPADSDVFLATLLNELFNLKEPIYLVIDDYHLINNALIHQDMIFFIENLPPRVHLVLTTRSEPPWPLARWRARGKMVEARQKNLRFSREETGALFETIQDLELNDLQVQTLHEKTEGWVTGLQLAAISLADSSSPEAFIENFAGSHRHVFHFLSEEVFSRQPEASREFLLRTSILKRFSASLCRAVTGRTESAELLAELERKNLFLIALDEDSTWYRYHPLFADLLLHQLKQLEPEIVDTLHEKAAYWFLEAGDPGEAVRHALEGNRLETAARIINDNLEDIIKKEGAGLINECLNQFPEELLVSFPYLAVNKAWHHLVHKGLEEAKSIIDLAARFEDKAFLDKKEGGEEEGRHEFSGMLAVVKAYYHIYKQEFRQALADAGKALQLLPTGNNYWRSKVGVILGDARLFSGNPKGAYHYYYEAHQNNRAYGNTYLILSTGFKVATTLHYLGRLDEAEIMTLELLKTAKESGLAKLSRTGLLWTLLGDYLREKGSLDEAERCIERGLLLSEPEKPAHGWNLLYRVALDYSRQDYDAAMKTLSELEQLHLEVALPNFIITPATAWKALILLELNRAGEAICKLREIGVTGDGEIPGGLERASLALARALLEKSSNSNGQAETILKQVENMSAAGESRQLLLESLLNKASLNERLGNSEVAEEALLQALQSGIEKGYYQTLLDQSRELVAVYKRIVSGNKVGSSINPGPEFLNLAGKLISALNHDGEKTAPGLAPEVKTVSSQVNHVTGEIKGSSGSEQSAYGGLIEELSPREIEILSLFNQGLSNQQVAQKIFLSPGTVKWHASNIYGKLGVRGRLQAVALARNLKLIS